MKKTFIGYYEPTETEFEAIWENCLFVFDTNTLLDLYRYSEETYNTFAGCLNHFKDRVWIPYRVGSEFQNNRLKCITDQKKAYSEISKEIDNAFNTIESAFHRFKQHKFINVARYVKRIKSKLSQEKGYLKRLENSHPETSKNDDIFIFITNIFDGKVGDAYHGDFLQEVISRGKERYKNKIPPGYKDAKKENDVDKYGDLLIWEDIINKSKDTEKDIIFVTRDEKEDWWQIHNGCKIGPRPELIQEFSGATGCKIWIYTPSSFIKHAYNIIEGQPSKSIINEIELVNPNTYNSGLINKAFDSELTNAFLNENIDFYDYVLKSIDSNKKKEIANELTNKIIELRHAIIESKHNNADENEIKKLNSQLHKSIKDYKMLMSINNTSNWSSKIIDNRSNIGRFSIDDDKEYFIEKYLSKLFSNDPSDDQ